MIENNEIFENLLAQITAKDVLGNASDKLASHQKEEGILEPTIDNYDYVVRVMTIDVSKTWKDTIEEKSEYVRKYITEVIYRLETFLDASPKVKRHSKLYFYRNPDEYKMPDEIEKMVSRERSFASNSSDHLDILFGIDYRIKTPRDLFMFGALIGKFAWGSSYLITIEGKSIAAQDHKCTIDRPGPLMSMLLHENGIERYKDGSGLFNELVETYTESAFEFFGETVDICENVRKIFHYSPNDILLSGAVTYVTKGRTRQCDIPKFLQTALETQTIDADKLCNEQYATFRITSAVNPKKVQISSWRLKFIWEHVEQSLKKHPRKITDYIIRVYDKDYIFFVFYLGTFKCIHHEDLDFDLESDVNDVCVILDGRWCRSEFWDTLAGILGLNEGFPQEELVKYLKKLDRQIYGSH